MRNLRLVQCLLLGWVTSQTVVTPCDSQVYCHGELLDTIQKLDMFDESKYFVDMGLKQSEHDVLESFNQLTVDNKANSTFMFDWVNAHFAEPGFEFNDVEFIIENDPQFLSRINDSTYRQWAHNLYKIWPQLGRGVKPIVEEQPNRTSFIPLKHQTVVPTGHDGRFRESYYWDTFWTVRGMLQCGLVSDVYEILLNFRDLIRQYGFIPNGTRKYYTKRSQPPFYIMMVNDLINHQPDDTKRLDMIREFIDSMMDEFDWWEKNRAVQVQHHTLHRFASDVNTNRPEAYLPDEHVLSQVADPIARAQLAAHITSAAESGWDFSYRWTGETDIENEDVLIKLRTRDIIPVDLNFILAYNAKALANFTSLLDDYSDKSEAYQNAFERQILAIEAILYNATEKSYFDYDLQHKHQNTQFFASNYVPLFTQVWSGDIDASQRQRDLLASLQRHDVASYRAGVPNSLRNTGQQWDYPNAWPPSTHMIIMGLFKSGNDEARQYSYTIASKWLSANYALFEEHGQMFEKINAETGIYGDGGEYNVQTGFGWTNGVVIDLLVNLNVAYNDAVAVSNAACMTFIITLVLLIE